MCPECEPWPAYLCMDGVCIGISVDNIKDSDSFLECSDKPILDAPEYKERMFLKVKKNRDSLKISSQKKHFQIFVLLNLTKTQECWLLKS